MAKTRRAYTGASVETTTSSAIASSGTTSFTVSAATNWPYGTEPYHIVVSPGTASEEKILVTRTGSSDTTINIASDAKRGQDGTSAVAHDSGATVYPVFTAVDADEANELTSTWTTKGDIVAHGASTFTRLAVGTNEHVLKADSSTATGLAYGQVATAGIAADAIDGTKIADDSINSEHYVDGSIDTAHIADLQVTTAKIAADAVDGTKIADDSINSEHYVDGSIDTAHIADLQVTTGKIAADAIDGTKIADDAVASEHIADNAVALGTQTTGNYVETVAAGTGITVTGSDAEGATKTIAIDTTTTNPMVFRGVRGNTTIYPNANGYADIDHNLGATVVAAFVNMREQVTTGSGGGEYVIALPVTAITNDKITVRVYEVNGSGNSDYTISTVFTGSTNDASTNVISLDVSYVAFL